MWRPPARASTRWAAAQEEGSRNVREVGEGAASKSLEVLRQLSSTGYLRKRVPQELVVLQGGSGMEATVAVEPGTDAAVVLQAVAAAAEPAVGGSAARARMQGYEGDPCGECGNYTLVRNGTCLKCNTCGGTSGCS